MWHTGVTLPHCIADSWHTARCSIRLMRQMLTLPVAVVAALFLVGCTTSREVRGPDGKAAYSISCNGAVNDLASCYEKAGDLCGAAGYEVLNSDNSSTPFGMANGRWNRSGGHIRGTSGAIVKRSMFVRCGKAG